MGNLAVIDITGLSPLAYDGIFDGPSAFRRVMDWARGIPGYAGTIFLAGRSDAIPEGAEILDGDRAVLEAGTSGVLISESWTEEDLITALHRVSLVQSDGTGESGGPEALFYVRGDCPLMDSEVTRTLWDLHYRYDAEYTFADGYPVGLAPEILAASAAVKLRPLAVGRRGPVARDSLFEVLRRDINAFDVETHLSPEDLRMDRVSITCDTRRNRDIAERLFSEGGRDAGSLCRIIPANRGLLRSLPAFFPVQVTDRCPQACSYCPFAVSGTDPRRGGGHMDAGEFAGLCRNIVDFAGDAVINLSLWGEPACHPEIGALIRSALAAGEDGGSPYRSRVLVETSGIGWNRDLLEGLAQEYSDGRLMWIVSMDASDPELYSRLRGEGFEEARQTAELLAKLFGANCWIQAVRMEENEEHLEDFYRQWKDSGAQVIIQKYDSFAGSLPDRQPADLSPLDRIPCWHLKRDMCILLDGSVPVCRTRSDGADILGNVFTDDLAAIWEAGAELHASHVAGEYPGPCAECDEYYTFNF